MFVEHFCSVFFITRLFFLRTDGEAAFYRQENPQPQPRAGAALGATIERVDQWRVHGVRSDVQTNRHAGDAQNHRQRRVPQAEGGRVIRERGDE